MKLSQILALTVVSIFVPGAFAQNAADPLDRYIDDADLIAIVECVSSGPINKIARAHVTVDVIYLVKGATEAKQLSTEVVGGLTPGETYLLRIRKPRIGAVSTSFSDDRINVISVERSDIDRLRTLSTRIVVLRVINTRLQRLENDIRSATFEKDTIAAIKGKN